MYTVHQPTLGESVWPLCRPLLGSRQPGRQNLRQRHNFVTARREGVEEIHEILQKPKDRMVFIEASISASLSKKYTTGFEAEVIGFGP